MNLGRIRKERITHYSGNINVNVYIPNIIYAHVIKSGTGYKVEIKTVDSPEDLIDKENIRFVSLLMLDPDK
jgi:hypothetical protein